MTTTTATTSLDGASALPRAPIIETVGLTKTYRGTDFRAVDELHMQVGTGEVFGLLGPNGAGKTTTVGVLTTRVIPTGGHAFVGGLDVVEHPTLVKQLIGVVSQQNTLDRQLTPWENLYWHGRLFGMGAKESRRDGQRPARKVPVDALRESLRLRPLGGHGAAPDGGACHLPPAGRSLP